MVSALFRVMMLTVLQVLSVSRRCERASESSEAENEIFFCERDNRILKDPETSSTHPDEFAYLPHLACAH
jgi:hypothetical protein